MFLTDTVEKAETMNIDWNALLNTLVNWCMTTGIRLIVGIIVLFISFKFINFLSRKIYKSFSKRKHDETLLKIGVSAFKITFKSLLLVIFVGVIGIETASISAVVASIGVGISLAVQGTLSNFAGGVIIIVMRPFRIGDYITSNGQSGTVEDIKLFYTHIATSDNKTVFVPNGTLANNVIVNTSMKETRRLEIVFTVSYDTNIKEAKEVIKSVIDKHADIVLVEPAPFINVSNLADSAIEITTRTWVRSENYWTLHWALMEEVKEALDEAGIEIPFNQLDVNLKK